MCGISISARGESVETHPIEQLTPPKVTQLEALEHIALDTISHVNLLTISTMEGAQRLRQQQSGVDWVIGQWVCEENTRQLILTRCTTVVYIRLRPKL